MPKDLVTILQGKWQLCIHWLHEPLLRQCEYTTQLKGSFRCHINGAVLLIFTINLYL